MKHAMQWARDNQLVRTNAVHGAEEFWVSTFESFSNREKDQATTKASGSTDLEDM